MSLASKTRAAVRERPFLHDALRAGVVNYRAAADSLALDGDPEAVATALRRYADDLPALERESRSARVRVRRGVGPVEPGEGDALLVVGGVALGESVAGGESADRAALLATGDVDARVLSAVLARLSVEDVVVDAAGVASGTLAIVVPARERTDALRVVEAALAAVPTN